MNNFTSQEIERKFFLKRYPQEEIEQGDVQIISKQTIDQTYLALTNVEEIRIRKIVEEKNETKTEHYTHTFKKGKGLSREEVEYAISKEIYDQLMEKGQYQPLQKVRTTAVYQGIHIEMDDYDQFDLHTVEVEFDSEEQSQKFHPPSWFGEEIGAEKEYRNKELWKSVQNDELNL